MSNPQSSDLFISQTDSSMPAKSGCLTVNVFVVFFQSAFSSPLRSAHATDTNFTMTAHHCQHWLKVKRRLFLSRVIISCLTRPPELLVFIACHTSHPFTFDPGRSGRLPNHYPEQFPTNMSAPTLFFCVYFLQCFFFPLPFVMFCIFQ